MAATVQVPVEKELTDPEKTARKRRERCIETLEKIAQKMRERRIDTLEKFTKKWGPNVPYTIIKDKAADGSTYLHYRKRQVQAYHKLTPEEREQNRIERREKGLNYRNKSGRSMEEYIELYGPNPPAPNILQYQNINGVITTYYCLPRYSSTGRPRGRPRAPQPETKAEE